ncbi:hypothetical protein NDU88_005527 [Pleurodeles waltl]|uniref:Uncharacterized protein n=1 Tax=Pleurodeles waltl TaxID=8319 RepID=A0AAV7UIB5_PLEWA|nr:hypothetical protein NDU88_005527 [Pleurodeles waltl]
MPYSWQRQRDRERKTRFLGRVAKLTRKHGERRSEKWQRVPTADVKRDPTLRRVKSLAFMPLLWDSADGLYLIYCGEFLLQLISVFLIDCVAVLYMLA